MESNNKKELGNLSAGTSQDDLERFGREYFGSEFPNPSRGDCPSREELCASARSGSLPTDNLRAHLFNCSDCFNEFKETASTSIVHEVSGRRLIRSFVARPLPALATLLVIVSLVTAIVMVLRSRRESHRSAENFEASPLKTSPTSTTSPTTLAGEQGKGLNENAGLAATVVKVDLRAYVALSSGERDAGARGSRPIKAITLRPTRTRITFRLPEGSASGVYTVSLLHRATLKPLVSTRGNADDGGNLDVQFNLDALAPGDYVLRLARSLAVPDDYLLRVSPK